MSSTAAMPMPVSLRAAADATRQRASHGARTGITEDAWEVILSLQESQRCVLADALLAGVDIAALLSEAREWMATAGRRLEFSFDLDGKAQFFGGTVTAVGKSDGWVDVAFDDGETHCVHLRPALEGTAWRWLPTDRDAGVRCSQSRSRKRKAGRPDEAAAGRGTTQRSETAATSRRRVLLTPPRPPPVRKMSTTAATAAKALEIGRRKTDSGTSRFHGVFWNTSRGGWGISASGIAQVKSESRRKQIKKDLARIFNDEQEAAKVADDVRRTIRGKDAHEAREARRRGMPDVSDKDVDDSSARQQGYSSKFLGVAWAKTACKWAATLERQYLGVYRDEVQAAQVRDQAAREKYGKDAHHHRRPNGSVVFLNFPTKVEFAEAIKQAKANTAIRWASGSKKYCQKKACRGGCTCLLKKHEPQSNQPF